MRSSSAEAPLIAATVEDGPNTENEEPRESSSGFVSVEYEDITKYFTLMGWTAFGGPQAHIGMFETVCIKRARISASSEGYKNALGCLND